ncbi:MAG TPA: hypothetical protein VGE79_05775 [Niastella sp.]
MSMWEIEALIENSINLVGKTEETNEKKIKLIGNLYALQKRFDCSFTNFRVMDVLLKTGYTKTIPYTAYPDYPGNEAFFEELIQKDHIEYIYRDIKEDWSEENEMVAYWEKESRLIYIDYGSPLRKDEGTVEIMNVFELGLCLVREAHKLNNKELIYDLTAFLLMTGPYFIKSSAEEIISKYFEEIRAIWSSYDHSDYEPLSESLTIQEPTPDDMQWRGGVCADLIRWFLNKQ